MDASEQIRKVYVNALKANEQVHTVFRVSQKARHQSRAGKPYLSLELADKTGIIDGRVFENVESAEAAFQDGDYLLVRGKVGLFQKRPQLVLEQIERLDGSVMDVAEFTPPPRPPRASPAAHAPAPAAAPAAPGPSPRAVAAALLREPALAQALEGVLKALEPWVEAVVERHLAGGKSESRKTARRGPRSRPETGASSESTQAPARDPQLRPDLAFKPLSELVPPES